VDNHLLMPKIIRYLNRGNE